ncbi:PHP domain-containing protein [Sporosalibacterium faouarense]|uniref:PHP domain-containing protein n=1 Tax=Sporosalibacterium faouarense TaxID=516123 RepID=UPI00141D08DA|nr:PHP domain-containing protein [Sporosalibacterium faouarense]MTI48063.1 PHP domain-containing protein [Bacillota bacterium]
MKKVDLHVHTTASDGIFTPSEVVDWAVKKDLKAIAVTDHDTTLGIEEAIEKAKQYEDFLVVPGIELSSDYSGEEIHILGYFIDINNAALQEETRKLKESRQERGHKMVEKLIEIGIDISLDEVKKITDKGFIGRPHVARVLVEKGYVDNIQEAFDKYLGRGKRAYANRYKLNVYNSIDLIHQAGGVAVMAHPGIIKTQRIVREIKGLGLDGVEAVHSKHSKDEVKILCQLAEKYNLISTGGSDCHGVLIDGNPLLGEYYVDFKVVEDLRDKAEKIKQG